MLRQIPRNTNRLSQPLWAQLLGAKVAKYATDLLEREVTLPDWKEATLCLQIFSQDEWPDT